ncbi:MAG: type II secretion system inner membrane protein GspF [Deltaproteobacteria bacterium]|nr:type II secretion system inner membrane protein GspF [Deltaproteobacteria bacterium]MBN2845863.1 type II secretion system inner membrane protein GspF [Deltaproteobacteria bacterium]
MAVYEYSALNVKGKRLKGIIDADSIISARQKLRETNIFPTDLRETTAKERDEGHTRISLGRLFKKVGLREISIMTRQLATLLSAGLPLVPSLAAIVSQTVNPHLKKTMAEIKEEVNEGNSLAESISHYPGIFSAFYVSMVRAGEASGALNIVLDRLADFNERQQALRGKVRAALTYPVFMFLVGSVVLFFMVTFIVPRITSIFEDMNQTLPGITILLISVSGFLRSFWFVLLLLIAALFAGLRYAFTKTERGKYMWDRIRLRMPLVGSLSHKIAVARFSRTLGTLLESGVPLLSALFIVKNIVNNRLISDVIENARKEVEEGQSLSGSLSKSELFPPLTIQMISVGEQSGNIEQMLYKVSDSYENEVESNIMMITSLLEPVMILVMGLFVGFIVISILLPIFEMNQLIR